MRWRKEVVSPTLLLSEAGVMVEALKHHVFPPGGKRMNQYHQEVSAPQGAAVMAVQFVHEVGERFGGLQVFKLHYVHRAPGRDLYDEYLAAPFDSIEMAATPVGPDALNANQRRVLTTLLEGSDAKAWEASATFRGDIQGGK
ncbi:MAG: hypothetical protein CYG59_20740 [Chloroflexi bacterium]|nr:MAG: hypothetical protein CYG59_20740 [Chloroflexota bacterium]